VSADLASRGVCQRVRALERFLSDVYGPGRCFDDGVLPGRLACASGKFRREAAGFAPPGGVRVHTAAIDLIHDEAGALRVLADHVRMPGRVSPLLDRQQGMPGEYPSRLLAALRAAAPPGVAHPFVVVLTPGVHSPAYPEHTRLARLMGVDLVTGGDLACHRNRAYVRSRAGRRPVDVIYRRVDDDWLDPLHFRPDSLLGCPGLLNAARAGNVTIANAVGNGVADDPLTYPYVPDLIRYYLSEEPLLENAAGPGAAARLARPARLRAFAVNDGREVWVLPAGQAGE